MSSHFAAFVATLLAAAATALSHPSTAQAPSQSPSGGRAASAEKSPSSRIAVAASANALTATQVNAPPTLTR